MCNLVVAVGRIMVIILVSDVVSIFVISQSGYDGVALTTRHLNWLLLLVLKAHFPVFFNRIVWLIDALYICPAGPFR